MKLFIFYFTMIAGMAAYPIHAMEKTKSFTEHELAQRYNQLTGAMSSEQKTIILLCKNHAAACRELKEFSNSLEKQDYPQALAHLENSEKYRSTALSMQLALVNGIDNDTIHTRSTFFKELISQKIAAQNDLISEVDSYLNLDE
jgi:predicted component of viral defense system (DUF524 family)